MSEKLERITERLEDGGFVMVYDADEREDEVDLGLVSKNKDFALLWASHLTSSFGDGLRMVALPWLVYI